MCIHIMVNPVNAFFIYGRSNGLHEPQDLCLPLVRRRFWLQRWSKMCLQAASGECPLRSPSPGFGVSWLSLPPAQDRAPVPLCEDAVCCNPAVPLRPRPHPHGQLLPPVPLTSLPPRMQPWLLFQDSGHHTTAPPAQLLLATLGCCWLNPLSVFRGGRPWDLGQTEEPWLTRDQEPACGRTRGSESPGRRWRDLE